jgi:hypothetical protein
MSSPILERRELLEEDHVAQIVEEAVPEVLVEDYMAKAEELENRLDRLEGRQNKEEMLATWFEENDSDVTVRPILKKGMSTIPVISITLAYYLTYYIILLDFLGMGMVSRRSVANDKLILVCPPYVCVPYEPRKRFVCAHCFKEYKYLEERHKAQVEAEEAAAGAVQENPNENGASEPSKDLTSSEPENIDASLAQLTVSSGTDSEKKDEATAGTQEEILQTEPQIEALLNCEGCHEVWYCNEECRVADLPEHGHYECQSLSRFDIPWAKGYYSYCDDLVTDIRLLIRAINKRFWQQEQGNLEFHDEYQLLISNMNCYTEDVLTSLRSIVQYTNYLLPDVATIHDDELLEIYCKHRVNMFGLWANGGECLGYGVYPRASYFNHSCWPNTTFYKNPDIKVPHMNFLTVWPIEKEGEEVCISYIDISTGLQDRRNTLLDKYFFHCTCERCMLQELSPQEPDPYYIYWAPAPPPDGYAPGFEPTTEETANGTTPAPPANDDDVATPTDAPTTVASEETPFEVVN